MFMFTGSWRLHKFVGLDSETKWRLVLFCWHLLAVSLFCLVFTRLQLSVPKLLKQENKSEKQKQKIRKPSTYQITIERSMTSEEEDSISRSSTGKEDLRRDERVGGEFQECGSGVSLRLQMRPHLKVDQKLQSISPERREDFVGQGNN